MVLTRITAYAAELLEAFGGKYLAYVFASQHVVKGFCMGGGGGGLVMAALMYTLRGRRVPASRMALLMATAMSPWSLKPVLGLLSDRFLPANRAIVALTSAAATVAYAAILAARWSSAPDENMSADAGIVLSFGAVYLHAAWVDLLTEAATADRVRHEGTAASALVSYTWGGISLAGLAGVALAGPAIDAFFPEAPLAFALPAPLIAVPMALLGWGDRLCGGASLRIRSGARLPLAYVASAAAVALSVAVMSVMVLAAPAPGKGRSALTIASAQATVAAACAAATLYVCARSLDRELFLPMLYAFLNAALWPNVSPVMLYFYTDPPDVCPGCPHFSASFYQTALGLVDMAAAAAGVVAFQRFLSRMRYAKAMRIAIVASAAASTMDVLQVTRWVTPHPLPDEALALGKGAVQNALGMMAFMPLTVLISRMSPPAIEGTVFALLAGLSNFGLSVGTFLGALLIQASGLAQVDGSAPEDDFSALPWVLAASSLLPAAALWLLAPVCLPDASMDDDSVVVSRAPEVSFGRGADEALAEWAPMVTLNADGSFTTIFEDGVGGGEKEARHGADFDDEENGI